MPADNSNNIKRDIKSGKPTISNDNHDENVGQRQDKTSDKVGDKGSEARGDAVRSAGNKVHGDKLEGLIGSSSEAERMNQRPTRDDGDNDDLGELDEPEIGSRH
jgi:hypothetical protein